MRANEIEHREFLLACATWQDTLLQSYRSLHVTIQGFLVAAGAAVLAVQLTGTIQATGPNALATVVFNLFFTGLLAFLFWLQNKTSKELRGVVESRACDIDFWHRRLILAENALDSDQRVFTYFKMWQQVKRTEMDHILHTELPPEGVTEQKAEQLIGKGIGHTRRVLDVNLFERLQLLWYSMLIASFGITGWFFYSWWLVH